MKCIHKMGLALFALLCLLQPSITVSGQDYLWNPGPVAGYEVDSFAYSSFGINPVSSAQFEQDGFIYLVDPALGLLKFDGKVVDRVVFSKNGEEAFVPALRCFHMAGDGSFHAIGPKGDYLHFVENGECTTIQDSRIADSWHILEAADGQVWFFADSLYYRDGGRIINSETVPASPEYFSVYNDSMAFFFTDNYDPWSLNDSIVAKVVSVNLLDHTVNEFVFDSLMFARPFLAVDDHTIWFVEPDNERLGSLDLEIGEWTELYDGNFVSLDARFFHSASGNRILSAGAGGAYLLEGEEDLQLRQIAGGRFWGRLLVDGQDQVWTFNSDRIQLSRRKLFQSSALPVEPEREPSNALHRRPESDEFRIYPDSRGRLWYQDKNTSLRCYHIAADSSWSYDLWPFDERTMYMMHDGDLSYRYPYGGTHIYYDGYNMINDMLEDRSGRLLFAMGRFVLSPDEASGELKSLMQLNDSSDEMLALAEEPGGDLLLLSKRMLYRYSEGLIWHNSEIAEAVSAADTTACDTKVLDFKAFGDIAVVRFIHCIVILSMDDGSVLEMLPTHRDYTNVFDMADLVLTADSLLLTPLSDSLLVIRPNGTYFMQTAIPGTRPNMQSTGSTSASEAFIATPGALYRYNAASNEVDKLESFRVHKRRKCFSVNSILWTIASNEVWKQDRQGESGILYMADDPGISTVAFSCGDSILAAVDRSSVLWFRPVDFPRENKTRSLVKSLSLGDTTFAPSQLRQAKKISVPHHQNLLSFELLSADLAASRQRNRYMVEGIDPQWNLSEAMARDQYRDMQPGSYTLKFQSEDIYGNWTEVSEIAFRIRPPWWMTKVAYAGYVILVILSFVLILRLRVRYLEREKVRLEKVVDERTEEIRNHLEEIESQRDEIEAQRDLLHDQNSLIVQQKQDLTDSIDYAVRIQESLLPDTGVLKDLAPDHFVLFQPKDVVSGDFYWFAQVDDAVIVVGADCTGHGVPGALISMLGLTYLDEIVKTNGIVSPASILDELRARIIKALQQDGRENELRDGMDIVALALRPSSGELLFAGAKNPLYVVAGDEIVVHKGDRFAVSYSEEITPFTQHSIALEKGAMVYLFSDGFPDQFGGPANKKYKYKPFREFLHSISDEPTEAQHSKLKNELNRWMGDNVQIDDILVMGIRVHGPEWTSPINVKA